MANVTISLDIGEQIGETKGEITEHLLYCVKSDYPFNIYVSYDHQDVGVKCWKVNLYKEDCFNWYGVIYLHLLDGRLVEVTGIDGIKGFSIVFEQEGDKNESDI